MENLKQLLQQAYEDPGQRQDYLDALDPIPYCQKVIYAPTIQDRNQKSEEWLTQLKCPEQLIKNLTSNTHGAINSYTAGFSFLPILIGQIKEVPLYVGEKIFQNQESHEDIDFTLRAHEGRHLYQQTQGFPHLISNQELKKIDMRPQVLFQIAELDANLNSLQAIQNGEYHITDPLKNKAITHYSNGITSLYNLAADSQSVGEKELIQRTLQATPHTHPPQHKDIFPNLYNHKKL